MLQSALSSTLLSSSAAVFGHTFRRHIFLTLPLSTLCWLKLFAYYHKKKFPKKGKEYASRVVSLIHAVVSTALSAYAVFCHPTPDFAGPTQEIQAIVLCVSSAYFAYDFIAMYLYNFWEWGFAIHHLVTAGGMMWGVFTCRSGWELAACTLLMEITNPLMHIQWLMEFDKKTKTLLYKIVEPSFAIAFWVARIGVGPFLTYATVSNEEAHVVIRGLACAMQLVSCVFAAAIAKETYHRLYLGRPFDKSEHVVDHMKE
eukprot:PhM_4_TR13438/c0_g1_i1/m.54957